jgi:hypothetical protein
MRRRDDRSCSSASSSPLTWPQRSPPTPTPATSRRFRRRLPRHHTAGRPGLHPPPRLPRPDLRRPPRRLQPDHPHQRLHGRRHPTSKATSPPISPSVRFRGPESSTALAGRTPPQKPAPASPRSDRSTTAPRDRRRGWRSRCWCWPDVNILSSQTLHQQEGKARVGLIAEPASPARPASQSEHHQHFRSPQRRLQRPEVIGRCRC